jgi:[ribosomal protein S5]-alanine N-acetyltransferase
MPSSSFFGNESSLLLPHCLWQQIAWPKSPCRDRVFLARGEAPALGKLGAQLVSTGAIACTASPTPCGTQIDMASRAAETFPTLITKRLRLRRFEPRDLAALHACFSDQDAMRFWNFPACSTRAETEKVLGWLRKTTSPYDHLAWAVAKKADDRCIGMVNYHRRDARNRRLEFGYIIAPKQQRNGFAAEALQALRDYCIDELKVHRIEALIHPDNLASIRLAKRLGFCCEGGPLTDYWRVGDNYVSVMIYAFISSVGAATREQGQRQQ